MLYMVSMCAHDYVHGDQRRIQSIFITLPYSLETGLSLNLELTVLFCFLFVSFARLAGQLAPSHHPGSALPSAGLQALVTSEF